MMGNRDGTIIFLYVYENDRLVRLLIERILRGNESMSENKLLLSQFANEEGFELTKYLTHLFEYVSHQLGQDSTPTNEVENT